MDDSKTKPEIARDQKRRSLCLALALGFCASASNAQSQAFVVHGMAKTCQAITDLDRARYTKFMQYFTGWTVQDYDAAIAWAEACAQYGWPGWSPTRIPFLRLRQRDLEQVSENAAQNAAVAAEAKNAAQIREAEAAKELAAERAEADKVAAAEVRKQNAIRQAAIQRAKATRECKTSQPYRLYLAQEAVLADLKEKDRWERALAKEQKIAEISGSENLTAKYYDGAAIVRSDEQIARDFHEYQAAGGPANGPLGVNAYLSNPCRQKDSIEIDDQ